LRLPRAELTTGVDRSDPFTVVAPSHQIRLAPVATEPADDGLGDFDHIYRVHAPRCLHVAMRVTNDHQHAQDAVQEAFLSFSRNRSSFDPARGTMGTWLAMLTHRRAVDVVRREAVRPKVAAQPATVAIHPGAADDPEERVADAIRSGQVQDIVRTLDATKRQIIVMAYYLGYTQTQIAEATGTPLGTVKTRNRDALRELRTTLTRFGAGSTGVAAGL
jgi:RNA polymerase sigma-70 factor (ECF subfamily)